MSADEQPTPADFAAPTLEDVPQDSTSDWRPQEATQRARRCRCGAHVSAEFSRVYSDAEGTIHACPTCADRAAIIRGAAADPSVPRRIEERWEGDDDE